MVAKVLHRRVEIEQPGHQVARGAPFLEDPHRRPAVRGVVVVAELLEHDVRPVVQLDVTNGPRLVVDVDLLKERHERDVGD